MVLGGAVELPAPRRSSEVLVHAAAAPGVPPLPGVAGLALARRAAGPGARGIQQAEQQQQRNRQHRGMVGEGRVRRKKPSPIQNSPGAPMTLESSGPPPAHASETAQL